MIVRDNTALEDIELLYPEVMAPDAKEKLMRLFNEIQADKNSLSDTCEAAEIIRKRIAQHEKEWESFQSLINPIYKTIEKEEIKVKIYGLWKTDTPINKNVRTFNSLD